MMNREIVLNTLNRLYMVVSCNGYTGQYWWDYDIFSATIEKLDSIARRYNFTVTRYPFDELFTTKRYSIAE